ncbi:phospho-N-acetylmuramoyl-pentapeptide-transferase [Microbacterium paludicola]|uniref:Phospho-N-acetylmuramoyl-pentapeptide-transferase n=1 Tax=Microbacterium paludicola TaxID=300019 RepID=A0A4Y9FZ06_9MICO|nr:phospho-N-acetylmuramoyl-pentapeptide-transferase [Microbacterium paludicola]MBF0815306.1 phospho-N-acetylmuramoyl-pentapeptide-transferase [Microbacterium paludicola]TFU34166.1 phospho-N-acetylmuramoyl-pentapeptide-transferase [Microbacterium paludicola]
MRSLLTAAAISLAFSLFLTPVFLRLFRRWGWAQPIRVASAKMLAPDHEVKRGTPTMGGTIFIVGTVFGYLVGCFAGGNPPTPSGWLVIWLMLSFGAVGFIDDYLKVKQDHYDGLSGWRKIAGQVLAIIPFGIAALNFENAYGQTPGTGYISLFRDIPVLSFMALTPVLGWLLYLAWLSLLGTGFSNSVNLTDGLDGLAAGAGVFVVGAYSLIAFWQFNQACTRLLLEPELAQACYSTRDPLDLAIVSAALVGGLVGFLWWNAPKAQVFMGDVGSMAIGGVVTAMAVLTRTELLGILIAGLFVISSGSVILQRLYFKATRGKRLFLMSPLHHHFEMRGWPEVTIVARFWIIAGLLSVGGIGLFYVEWLSRT